MNRTTKSGSTGTSRTTGMGSYQKYVISFSTHGRLHLTVYTLRDACDLVWTLFDFVCNSG